MGRKAEDTPMSALDKMISRALGENVPLGSILDPIKESCPNLWACLSSTAAGADHLMSPARLSLSLTPGGVIVGLSSQALAFSLDTSCVLMIEAFEAMEKALTGPAPAFRVWDNKEVRLRKRKKDSP
jgi:hypothetical protein